MEARSLVPGSPLPGVLSAVWTSLRIRGRGPSLDTMLCKNGSRQLSPMSPKCRALTPTSQNQQVCESATNLPCYSPQALSLHFPIQEASIVAPQTTYFIKGVGLSPLTPEPVDRGQKQNRYKVLAQERTVPRPQRGRPSAFRTSVSQHTCVEDSS